jgi:isoleucyl-tRNA synthetase
VTTSLEQYRLLPAERSADDLERELLEAWRAENLFARTLQERAGAPPVVFFEGPPTANGRPGIHHVFSRTIKDLFCRHRHMRGHYVLRKAGWDTHGLPVEIEVEKQLGINGKQDIEAFGVEEFNRRCRESVFTYRAEWEQLSERIAYWLDYEHPYVTFSNEYVESVWWALATLYQRGLLFRGHKILPYCPRCGTALSSHEVAQGYEDVEDPSIYIAVPLEEDGVNGAAGGEGSALQRRMLVWTTTPWTLVSNVALAVHPDLEYVELRKRKGGDWTLILAVARAAAVLGEDYTDRWEIVRRLRGGELIGRRYRRPLDWLPIAAESGNHEIIVGGDFVSADDGSGIVHLAPAFGADDYAMGRRHDLAFLQPVNAKGEFNEDVPVVGGKWIKDADPLIIAELSRRDVLWKSATITHSYPHCWRCGTPLLYYARGSWFIRTTAYRDEMLSRNARVDWHPPEAGEGRFGEWLKNNVDWAISRDRYWGTPLPVWVCERNDQHVEVIASYEALASRAGRTLPPDFDPHKPFVDRYTWECAACRIEGAGAATMRRVPEVIDTWFDSGSMSFAQWHYPFENRDQTAAQYPADFIAEGIDQTRGWFYSLLAVATGLGDALPDNDAPGAASSASREPYHTAPYRSVVVNDLVLDAAGEDVQEPRQCRESVGSARTARRRCGPALPRLGQPARCAASLRRKRHPRNRGTLPGHLSKCVQRNLRAVCQLWLGALEHRPGARRAAPHRSMDSVASADRRARGGPAAGRVRCHRRHAPPDEFRSRRCVQLVRAGKPPPVLRGRWRRQSLSLRHALRRPGRDVPPAGPVHALRQRPRAPGAHW